MDYFERVDAERKAPAFRMNTVHPAHDVSNLIVDRDPCQKCGIRGDIGCKHRNPS